MSNGSRILVASLTALATLVMFVASASSQDVHRYGDQGSSSSGSGGGGGGQNAQTVYPGQPMPQQSGNQQQSNRRQQQGQKGKKGDQPMRSYEIRLHEGSKKKGSKSEAAKKLNQPADKMYKGIIPGKREQVDHLKEEQKAGQSPTSPNRLTWIGFQPEDDKTRIFVQMSRQPDYSVSRADRGKRIIVTLENAKVTARNFRRHIDTSYFDRAVQRIETKVVGQDTVELHISLNSAKNPSVEAKDDYLYVDFDYQKPETNESDESGE